MQGNIAGETGHKASWTRSSDLRNLKILHIQKVSGIAGSERHLLTLLPALKDFGFEPTMLVLAGRNNRSVPFIERMRSAGVPTRSTPIHHHLDPTLLSRVIRCLKRESFDLVHTHLLHADLYGGLASSIMGLRRIASLHNDNPFRRSSLLRPVIRWNRRLFHHLICISHHLGQFANEVEGVPARKISVVHYGFQPKPPSSSEPYLRNLLHLPEGKPIVGMVARLTTQKGHSTLLRAMSKLIQQSTALPHLVLVGDGELRSSLEALASQLKLDSHVSFLGYRPDASHLIYDFDIFVHPSRWEGFGLVFLEAMAAGVPIIATRTSAIPEIVEDGETGLLVPVDDGDALSNALSLLLANPPLRKKMGRAGRRRLEKNFSVQKMVEETAKIYQQI